VHWKYRYVEFAVDGGGTRDSVNEFDSRVKQVKRCAGGRNYGETERTWMDDDDIGGSAMCGLTHYDM